MPINRTTEGESIGSQGLEQGGPNLGNDYSRPTKHVEQNQTTNIGSHGTDDDESLAKKRSAGHGLGPDIEQEIETPRGQE